MHDANPHNHTTRERLTRDFFQDYLLRCRLRQPDGEDADAQPDETSNATLRAADVIDMPSPAPFDLHELLPGQIRLLSQPDEMVWVLILRPWGETGNFLAIPFSPIPFPATDEEWLLGGRRAQYLDVLQIWNARTLHALFLRRSWLVATLNSAELQAANTLFDASLTGTPLPDTLLQNTGLPIFRADDPRLEYKSESLARLERLDAADFHWNELCAEAASQGIAFNHRQNPAPRSKKNAGPTLLNPDFTAPLFQSMPLAADGRTAGSPCWDFPMTPLALLTSLCQQPAAVKPAPAASCYAKLDGLCPSRIRTGETPPLLWNLPATCTRLDADALFFHRESQRLLGSGYLSRQGNDTIVALTDWADPEHPDIPAPDAVTIFLANPSTTL